MEANALLCEREASCGDSYAITKVIYADAGGKMGKSSAADFEDVFPTNPETSYPPKNTCCP